MELDLRDIMGAIPQEYLNETEGDLTAAVRLLVEENTRLRKEVNQLRYQLDVLMGND